MLAMNTFGYDILFIFVNIVGLLCFRSKIFIPYEIIYSALFYRMMVVVGSTFAAAMHRRHLMVWAVFAPKLIFEATFFVVYSVACLPFLMVV